VAEERILIVDDEPGVRTALENILADEGFTVVTASSGEAGLEVFDSQAFDAVLLDVWLPGIDGLETLQRLREKSEDSEIVMISGHGTIETAVRATKLGAFDFVEKPLSLEKTLLVLRNALRQRRLEKRNRQLLEQLSRDTKIIGRSPAAESLRRQIAVAASTSAPVLISGEQGSGRETVARRIHASGGRAEGPFVDLPFAALDARAASAALYGDGEQRGRIDLALGGSLFLDEVERLDASEQRRLAARLKKGAEAPATVRVIASSSSEGDGIEASLLRLLEVVRIRVPALRERRDDLPLFAERFMRDLAREYGTQPKRWAPDCLAALKAFDWPGNVRQLRNLIERLLLFAPGELVRMQDLPESLGGARPPAEDLYREFASLADGMHAFERYYVARILAAEDSDRVAAARRLGLGAEELERLLEQP
jgi:two-component system nitrogen regulation response regulator NtrX